MFYVYVLYSLKDQGLYIGFSTDLRRRFAEHQQGKSAATAHRGTWVLAHYEAYAKEADARGRERFLKSGAGHTYLRKQLRHFFAENPLRVKSNTPSETA